LGLYTVDAARHFHSELTDSAHFGEKRPLGTPQEQKRYFPKSRVDWAFLQIVVQSLLFLALILTTQTAFSPRCGKAPWIENVLPTRLKNPAQKASSTAARVC
jgi:hypothetical protein